MYVKVTQVKNLTSIFGPTSLYIPNAITSPVSAGSKTRFAKNLCYVTKTKKSLTLSKTEKAKKKSFVVWQFQTEEQL